jgi:hypothetical protein
LTSKFNQTQGTAIVRSGAYWDVFGGFEPALFARVYF